MLIQVEKIYLFETSVNDPYFLGTIDGVTAKMVTPRYIELLDILKVFFFIDFIGKGGLSYTMRYGGEDTDIVDSYGKSQASYSLEFNMPVMSQNLIEQLAGKQFSLLAMRRDKTFFVIFGQFEMENFKIDNEVQQRVTFKTGYTNSKIYTVQSYNITEIVNVVDVPLVDDLTDGGFDYELDFAMD